jgi:hypothetical protein
MRATPHPPPPRDTVLAPSAKKKFFFFRNHIIIISKKKFFFGTRLRIFFKRSAAGSALIQYWSRGCCKGLVPAPTAPDHFFFEKKKIKGDGAGTSIFFFYSFPLSLLLLSH